jgi:hypothetical protein
MARPLLLGLLLLLTPADNLLALGTPQSEDDVQAESNDEFLTCARQGPSRQQELAPCRCPSPCAGPCGEQRLPDEPHRLPFLLDPLYVFMSLRR